MFVANDMCISDVCHHEILGFVGFQPETYFVSEDFHPWKCTSSSYGLTAISEKDLSLTPKNHGTFYFQDDKEFLTCIGHIYGLRILPITKKVARKVLWTGSVGANILI